MYVLLLHMFYESPRSIGQRMTIIPSHIALHTPDVVTMTLYTYGAWYDIYTGDVLHIIQF